MLVTDVLRSVILLLMLGLAQGASAANPYSITAAEFCRQQPTSCLGGQSPSLPWLSLTRQQTEAVDWQKIPELVSDDPSVMLPALQRLLQGDSTLLALFYLPVDEDCFPCRIWREAANDWRALHPELPLQLVLVGSL